jgi:saccharopine dehydrogenase-like NADP-dependent oxidoreductase
MLWRFQLKVLLLGVGKQGKAALHDLVQSQGVTAVIAADRNLEALRVNLADRQYGAKVRCDFVDAEDPDSIERLMKSGVDVAIDLLPAHVCGRVAAAAVQHRVHLVNTFYTVPEVKDLTTQAESRNVTILPEFGLDPGIDLVMLGEAVRTVDEVEEIWSYGGGIPEPVSASNPLKYKVTWNFEGVLNSYRRTGKVIRDGTIVHIQDTEMFYPENVHQIDIEGVGRLEAFPNGDALKYAELLGIHRPKLKALGRFALRWPGHCAFWRTLVDLHLLDSEPVMINGVAVDRKRYLAAALEPHLQYSADERDMVILRTEVKGKKMNHTQRIVVQMIDRRDLQTGFTAMSRTVGYTASIGAQMIATGKITKRGVLTPVNDIPYADLKRELAERGIRVTSEVVCSE